MLPIIFYIFIGIVLIQIIYCSAILGTVTSNITTKQTTTNKLPISILVYTKNQAEYVKKIVPFLINQSHPNFEIILINDASEDDSLDIMKEFTKQYSNIKIVNVINNEAFWENKRYTLTLGIKAAKNEHLLLTEANSFPDSANWISEMSSQFSKDKRIILGHNRIEKMPKSFINKLFRFENTMSCANVFSWTILGKPFIGYGHNLAYTKEDFFKVNGFINYMNIQNGEDVLFINQICNTNNTAICNIHTAYTAVTTENSFKNWMKNLKTLDNKFSLLGFFDQLKIRFYNLIQLLLFITAIVLLSFQFNWMIVLGILVIRYIIIWGLAGKTLKKFNEKDIVYWFPILEFIYTFTQFYTYISNSLSKSKH